jgi:acylphosphatase
MADPPEVAIHAVVSGRVQGVGFRYSTQRIATKLGLVGWVRNLYDGTVEVRCEGPSNNVARFVRWLEKGPPGSHVVDVAKQKVPSLGTYRSFTIEF